MATGINGKLRSERDVSGFRISVNFIERVTIPEGEPAFVPSRRETLVDPSGNFSIEIPVMEDRQSNVQIQAISNTGLVAGGVSLPAEGPFADIVIDVAPVPVTEVTPSSDLTLGASIKFTGRAIDPVGRGIRRGLTIIIWTRKPDENKPKPVSVAVTSEGGYFSDAWPTDFYEDAFAVVSGGKPIPILLENNLIPRRIILIVESVPESKLKKEDCLRDDAPPRAPDAIDLAQNPEAFSADNRPCVDFTMPNRTVEEVTYQAVVRTTQPEIRGRARPKPLPIPPKILDKLAELADARPDDIRVQTTAQPVAPLSTFSNNAAVSRTAPLRDLLIVNKDALKFFETVVARAQAFAPGINLDNQPVFSPVPSDDPAQTILKERIKNKTPIRLEPTVLAELVRGKEEVTPRKLLQAEQVSIVRQFRNHLGEIASPAAGRFVLSDQRQIEWDQTPDFSQAVTIAHGHILTFKQVWRADGYSLGDLLYSLPLAPGQQKRISFLDWRMDQVASRRANRRVTEDLTANLTHDRDVDDIIRSSLSEHMDAESHADTASVGGAIGGFIGSFVFGAAGGVSSAGSTASQTSARDVAGIALNKVRDRTAQAASAIRSQRSTVVQETRQGESVMAQTEVVGNYNHCHALTIEYFEILRHFQVTQEIAHVQECLFNPFAITSFNLDKAARWKDPLRGFLRNRSFGGAFDAVDRVRNNWAQADFPDARYAEDPIRYLDGEFVLRIRLPRPADSEDGGFVQANWVGYEAGVLLWETPEEIFRRYLGSALAKDRHKIWDDRIAPGIAQRIADLIRVRFLGTGPATQFTLDSTLVSRFAQDRSMLVSMRVGLGAGLWTRAQVERIQFFFDTALPAGVEILVESATMNYRTSFLAHTLFTNRRLGNDLSFGDEVEIPTPLDTIEKRNPKERDRRLAERLVDHLNEHIEYYHRAIWFGMDPNRRYLLLDGFIAPDAGGRSVASVVENRVVGIVGNSLVMPVAPGQQLDSTYVFADDTAADLRHLYSGNPAPPIRISVPTSGVFAEAVMGRCNSCEVIDDTKFWRWEEAAIPDAPTLIAPLSTESRRTAPPSLAPDALAEPIVRLQQTPDAPDPTGLAAAIRALGTNNIFKDFTGVALNQESAANALKASIKVGQEFATKAGALAQQKFLNKELDRTVSQIKSARDKGLISDEQAQKLTESALGGAIGEKRNKPQNPTDSPEVKKAMKRVSNARKGSMRVTRPNGTVEVNTDNSVVGNANRIDVNVDPPVGFIRQKSNLVCWAAGATMMLSWRDQQSRTVEETLDGLGGDWRAKFERNKAFTAVEFRALMAAIGAVEEGPASYTPEGLAGLIQNKGPLLEIGDDGIANNLLVHVRIVTGMLGDGTMEHTKVSLIDADAGVQNIDFTIFDQRHSGNDVVVSGLGIFHF